LEERALIEEGFRAKKIRVICSTTTLSAGVNTPAKNVIFLSHKTHQDRNISTASYKNMSGRAGRIRERDNFGRSILFARTPKELEMLWKEYVTARPEPVESRIATSTRLDTSLLGLIASGTLQTIAEIEAFMRGTFFSYSQSLASGGTLQNRFEATLRTVLKDLQSNGFIDVDGDTLRVTELGKVCAEELLSPRTVALFHRVLSQNSDRLNDPEGRGKLVEPLIHLAVCSEDGNSALLYGPKSDAEREELQAIYEKYRDNYLYDTSTTTAFFQQFRTTRMLARWIDGVSYAGLSQYGLEGVVKRTAETISWILKGMARLTEKPLIETSDDFQLFLHRLIGRVYYGVPSDAVKVVKMRIPGIGRSRAIQLADAGFRTVNDLIAAKPESLILPGIGQGLALRVKEYSEKYIRDEQLRLQQSHIRRALETRHDATLLKRLYTDLGSNFARAFVDILKEMKLNAMYIGDATGTNADALVITQQGKIAIEGKRKESGNVSAKEAEEIRGKGARHKPISYVTVGYPDFVEESRSNAKNTRTTLIRADIIGEAMLSYWEGNFDSDDMIDILKSGRYVDELADVVEQESPIHQ
jgi:replicative superfamily II helicase